MPGWREYFSPGIRKLGGKCSLAFFVGFGACTVMYRYAQVKTVSAPHFTRALEILTCHKDAMEALGPPVGVDSRFDFVDRRTYKVDPEKLTFWAKLPVRGTLDFGNLYVNGVYDDDERFQITLMELTLKRLEKRFRIFELDEADITIGRGVQRKADEDELDSDIVASLEKRKWFNLRWLDSAKT